MKDDRVFWKGLIGTVNPEPSESLTVASEKFKMAYGHA
jgi:hypothetical protein